MENLTRLTVMMGYAKSVFIDSTCRITYTSRMSKRTTNNKTGEFCYINYYHFRVLDIDNITGRNLKNKSLIVQENMEVNLRTIIPGLDCGVRILDTSTSKMPKVTLILSSDKVVLREGIEVAKDNNFYDRLKILMRTKFKEKREPLHPIFNPRRKPA